MQALIGRLEDAQHVNIVDQADSSVRDHKYRGMRSVAERATALTGELAGIVALAMGRL